MALEIQDVIVQAQLKVQLEIEKARLRQQRNFSMNKDMQVEGDVTEGVIQEIEFQLEILQRRNNGDRV